MIKLTIKVLYNDKGPILNSRIDSSENRNNKRQGDNIEGLRKDKVVISKDERRTQFCF